MYATCRIKFVGSNFEALGEKPQLKIYSLIF